MPLTQRALTLGVACIVGLSCGTNYVYSAYAPQLASRLALTSTETNIIGAAGNMGVYLSGPFIGRFVDRNGPTRLLVFAMVALFAGYFAIQRLYAGGEDGLFATAGVVGVALAELLVGIGSTAGLSAAGNTVAKSYRKNRATALSLVLSTFGLSAFFYSNLWRSAFRSAADPTSAFLLLLALGTGISMALGAVFVIPSPHPSLTEPADSREEDEQPDEERDPLNELEESSPTERTPLKGAAAASAGSISVSGWALTRELDFWLLFLFNGLCSGVGLMYINNLGTVTRSLASKGTSPSDIALSQASLVSLLSLFNCLGRICVGSVSDYAVHRAPTRWRFSRVWWNVSTASLYAISQVLASRATTVHGWSGLAAPTILTGFAHGSLFGISGVLVLERFGMKTFSSNNGILALAPALFGQSSNYMFGRIYDHHVPVHTSLLAVADKTCTLGRDCFATAFHVTTGMAALGILVGIVLSSRETMRRAA
ncbi:major facilitator superfamily domain-containing protein [Leucosporidium creatinivorum]|uniref:Major facilitator superfamily domain-containing protein n=1 Tax=Leucosporidium creatinivorum TaxID=106004 RepID=A0A1Y2C5I0_9BASI|nr:major facilitator superfamily domain-containing protein [Leucosporidium creatinivorum]